MLRIRNLSNAMQKRTLRVLHGQTQATPYAGTLDPRLRNADGSFRAPLGGDAAVNSGLVRAAAPGGNAFTLQGGLVPGTVMVKSAGEAFVVGTATAGVTPFGLLANFVGGTLDDLQDSNEIVVWYGPGSVYEVLFPAFDDTGLATAYSNANASATLAPQLLYCQPDGRLGVTVTTGTPVAQLIERRSAGVIQIKLLV